MRNADGQLVDEHVYAPTDPATHQQVPVPMEVTYTLTLARLLHPVPGAPAPQIVGCSAAEVAAFLGEPEGNAAVGPPPEERWRFSERRSPRGRGYYD